MTLQHKYWMTTALMMITICSWFINESYASFSLVAYMFLSAVIIFVVPTQENKNTEAEHSKTK